MSLSVSPVSLMMKPPIEIALPPGIRPVNTTPPAPSTSTKSTSTNAGAQDDSSVSIPGTLLSKLQILSTSQPQKFQSALTQAANGLSIAANQAGTSTPQGQLLSQSASQIQQAANTGDVSHLQPPPATNIVQKTYGPNQAGGGQGVLSLFTTGLQAESAGRPVQNVPDLFGAESAATSTTDNSAANNSGSAESSVVSVLQALRNAVSQS